MWPVITARSKYTGRVDFPIIAPTCIIIMAKRALYAHLSKSRKLQLPLHIQCHLFDACIVPILLHGCEVWGFSNIEEVEKVHNYFCKYILHLSPRTANCMARGELGRPSIQCMIKQSMVNFWARLTTGKSYKISSTLLQIVMEREAKGLSSSVWASKIVSTINESGMGYILNTPSEHLSPLLVKSLLKDRLNAMESQNWHSSILDSGHCTTYQIYKNNLKMENYLTTLTHKEANHLCRFRCGNHYPPIVSGRYSGIKRCEGICTICDTEAVGDESHYIFICPAFAKERATYLSNRYNNGSMAQNMTILFTSEDVLTMSNLSKFCCVIMDRFKPPKPSRPRIKTNMQLNKRLRRPKTQVQNKTTTKVENITNLIILRQKSKTQVLKERRAKRLS